MGFWLVILVYLAGCATTENYMSKEKTLISFDEIIAKQPASNFSQALRDALGLKGSVNEVNHNGDVLLDASGKPLNIKASDWDIYSIVFKPQSDLTVIMSTVLKIDTKENIFLDKGNEKLAVMISVSGKDPDLIQTCVVKVTYLAVDRQIGAQLDIKPYYLMNGGTISGTDKKLGLSFKERAITNAYYVSDSEQGNPNKVRKVYSKDL